MTVTYHGTCTELHGPMIVIGWCDCGPCKDMFNHFSIIRYELEADSGVVLCHVRRASFTVPTTEDEEAA